MADEILFGPPPMDDLKAMPKEEARAWLQGRVEARRAVRAGGKAEALKKPKDGCDESWLDGFLHHFPEADRTATKGKVKFKKKGGGS